MGPTQSQGTLPELKHYDLIKEDICYKIYENSEKQVELWQFQTTEQNQEAEQQFIKQLQSKPNYGLANIISYNLQKVKQIFTDILMFNILTEHPKYTLRELFYEEKLPNKKQLNSQEIIDLTMQVIGAQLVLGTKSQYLSFNNIFTNDGKYWMLKPFLSTQSGYESFKKLKNFEGGFPAPEENSKLKQYDISRVQIFGFGLILLELILGKHTSKKLYDNNGEINLNALNEKTISLKQQKQNYTEEFIEFVASMIDSDLSRRPSFKKLSEKFQTSKIISDFRNYLKGEPVIVLKDQEVFAAGSNIIQPTNIKQLIIQVESRIEIIITSKSQKLQNSIQKLDSKKLIQQLDGTAYQGDLINGMYQGDGKLFSRSGEKVYEGGFKNGLYHGFGIIYFIKNKAFQHSLDYNDLTKYDQFAKQFEGDFLDGKKFGNGKVIFYNGEKFIGDFKDDLPHGHGKFTNMNQFEIAAHWNYGIVDSTYISDESQNIQSNNLISTKNLTENKSSTYNYQIKRLELQDQLLKSNMELSKKQQEDIKIQKDIFFNLKFTGQSEQYFQSGSLEYSGDFREGLYDGLGQLYNEHPNKNVQIDIKNFNIILQNNAWFKYSGSFKMGKKDGEGSLILSDMSEYQGQFSNDTVDGEGLITRKNKDDILAQWEKGILVKIIYGNI